MLWEDGDTDTLKEGEALIVSQEVSEALMLPLVPVTVKEKLPVEAEAVFVMATPSLA